MIAVRYKEMLSVDLKISMISVFLFEFQCFYSTYADSSQRYFKAIDKNDLIYSAIVKGWVVVYMIYTFSYQQSLFAKYENFPNATFL